MSWLSIKTAWFIEPGKVAFFLAEDAIDLAGASSGAIDIAQRFVQLPVEQSYAAPVGKAFGKPVSGPLMLLRYHSPTM